MFKNLVIAEKPSAGKDYAKILGCTKRKNGYMEGQKYIVTWSFGHLFSLAEPEIYDSKYKRWTFEDLPIVPGNFKLTLIDSAKKQYRIIKELINRDDVNLIINGGDAGREGELIQRYIINSTKTTKPIKRLWVSSLTAEAIRKGFNNLQSASKYDSLYQSAKIRAEIDWLIGINYTRAYTTQNMGNKVIVIGRVQTAILNLIYVRENENKNFKPIPYKEIEAEFENYKGKYIDNNNYRIFDFDLADQIYNDCKNEEGKIKKISKKLKFKYAPKLFNLTDLQKLMNKKYKFSSQKTLNIAQNLYENYKILSYPRTDSKFLAETHKKEIPGILNSLNFTKYSKYFSSIDIGRLRYSKRFIDDSKITDHHAIIPVHNKNIPSIYQKLSLDEKLLFDEVVKRLVSQFLKPYRYESTQLITDVSDYQFESKGIIVLDQGWKAIYPDKNKKDKSLPVDLKKDMIKKVKKINMIDKKTEAPALFDESDLLAQLDKYSIGTVATRAGIIEKLLSRKYIVEDKKKLITTAAGRNIIDIINTEELKNPELTGILERKLEGIRSGEIKSEKLLSEEINKLESEIKKLKDINIDIGKANVAKGIVACPACQSGAIVKRKSFYGCTNWNIDNINCGFTINKIAGKMLTENQLKMICEKGKTNILKGFKNKKGKRFSARLKLDDNFKVNFAFPDKNQVQEEISCPICKKGKIIDKGQFFGCSDYNKSNCKFTISKNILSKKITITIIKKLCEEGYTTKLKGFKSKTGKPFSARLKLAEGKVKFDF